MAEYLILIFEDESAYATATPDVFQQVMDAHNRFAEQVPAKGGKIVEGRALQPTATATTSPRIVVAVAVGCRARPSTIFPPFSGTCSANRLCAAITCWNTSGVAVA